MEIPYTYSPEELELLAAYPEEEQHALRSRIESGELSAYVFGKKYFYRSYFEINRDCLIPRPDTERVVEAAVSLLPEGGAFADLCAGCGCIGLSVLLDRKDAEAALIDVSPGALEAAKKNALSLGVSERAHFSLTDITESGDIGGIYDMIVSNPPYLRTDEISKYPSLAAEPRIALDGGSDGLIFYRRIITAFEKDLKKDGFFVFEIGYSQAEDIKKLAGSCGFDCKIIKDYGGNDRVAILRKGTAV